MPRFSPSVLSIDPYRPGTPAEVIAAEYGIDHVVKLASNEYSGGPFPGVVEAAIEAARHPERYPDNSVAGLRHALAGHHGIAPDSVLVGAGSSELLQNIALAVGGPDTSAVFPTPSFVLYDIVTRLSGARGIAIANDGEHRLDLAGLSAAVAADTSVVYVCNPNNPTGTHRSHADITELIESVPESVLVVVDEAYAEFADAEDYGTLVASAPDRPNLVVLRTFSKIYALADYRVGYAIGHPETLSAIARAQRPFTVTAVAQAAARASLDHDITGRQAEVRSGRSHLEASLRNMGLAHSVGQANFVWFDSSVEGAEMFNRLAARGVVIRNYGAGTWARVTVGDESENQFFLEALAGALGD